MYAYFYFVHFILNLIKNKRVSESQWLKSHGKQLYALDGPVGWVEQYCIITLDLKAAIAFKKTILYYVRWQPCNL